MMGNSWRAYVTIVLGRWSFWLTMNICVGTSGWHGTHVRKRSCASLLRAAGARTGDAEHTKENLPHYPARSKQADHRHTTTSGPSLPIIISVNRQTHQSITLLPTDHRPSVDGLRGTVDGAVNRHIDPGRGAKDRGAAGGGQGSGVGAGRRARLHLGAYG